MSNGKTQASLIYDQIRQDIISGFLKPGEPLRVEKLSDRYETSGSPVREALNRLSANGMVGSRDNRGFRVPAISRDELIELYKTRCWIEEMALRESISNGDTQWEEALVLSLHRLSRIPRSQNEEAGCNAEFDAMHREFHLALVNACGSRFMIRFCHQLHDQSDRYRQLAVSIAPRRESENEHQEIMKAAIDRDADKAVELLIGHYERTKNIILESDLE